MGPSSSVTIVCAITARTWS